MDNVKQLAIISGDASQWDVRGMVASALEECNAEKINLEKGILIVLDESDDGAYDFHWWNAGMRATEIVALLEIVKSRLIRTLEE